MIPKELTDFIIAVMRKGIECELRGVGIVPYSAFEASKVRDIRLEPVQHYSYYEDIR